MTKSVLGRSHSVLLLLAGLAVGCGIVGDGADPLVVDDLTATDGLFGDDRVSDALKGHLDRVPGNYAAAEKLFGVGRACARQDSKEIYIVEEAQSRSNGRVVRTTTLLPRAVVTGCNTPEHTMKETSDPESGSFSLFIALFSNPEQPSAADGDAMVVDHVEAMALDRRTGLYNFYLFSPGSTPDGPGSMQRIRLMPNNDVMVSTLAGGTTKVQTAKSENRRCNNCHVNMGPLMNELHEPWTNWISVRNKLPPGARGFTGETRSIVDESISIDGSHGRSSFAHALEKTIVAGIRVGVEGLAAVPDSGFARANLAGTQPKGVAGLLKSVFCQTELQYESAFDTEPLELFVDPGAIDGAQIQRPTAPLDAAFPILFPVRSEMDKRIETSLLKLEVGPDADKKRLLTKNTTVAIRLLSEANDIFAPPRCGLYPTVLEAFPSDPTKVEEHVRRILRSEVDKISDAATRDYATALLTDGVDPTAARAAYFDAARKRMAANVAKLDTPEGRAELTTRSNSRKGAALVMFPGADSPLPLLRNEAP